MTRSASRPSVRERADRRWVQARKVAARVTMPTLLVGGVLGAVVPSTPSWVLAGLMVAGLLPFGVLTFLSFEQGL